jgi:hypothetical protein
LTEKPCCAAVAARKIKQIKVNGIPVGLSQLDEVFAEVESMGLANEEEVGKKLLKRIMVFNYVPPGVAPAYKAALLKEYRNYLDEP